MIGNFFSRLGNAFILILMIVLVLIGFLPSILSSDWGKKQIVEWINLSIPGKVTIDHLNFQWGKGQAVEGISLLSPEGHPVLHIKKIATDASLWDLIWPRTDMGGIEILGLNGSITSNQQGLTNLQKTLGLPLISSAMSPTSFSLSNVSFVVKGLDEKKTIAGIFKGESTKNGQKGFFDLNFEIRSVKKTKWEDLLTELIKNGGKNLYFEISLKNVIVELMDEILSIYLPSQRGLLDAILGETIDLTLKKDNELNLEISSPLLQTHYRALIEKNQMNLQEPSELNLKITPDLFHFFFPDLKLNAPSRFKVTFETLSIPLSIFDDVPLNPCLFGFQGIASVDPLDLQIASGEPFLFENLAIDINAPLCNKKVMIDVNGKAGLSKLQGSIGFDKPKRFSEILDKLNGYFEVSNFPLFFLSREEKEIVGKEMHMKLDISSSLSGNQILISARSDNIQLDQGHFAWNRGISIEKPLNLQWNPPREWREKQKIKTEQLQIYIQKLNFPLSPLNGREFLLDLSLNDQIFDLPGIYKNMTLKNFQLISKGKQLEKIQTDTTAEIVLFEETPIVEHLKWTSRSTFNLSSFGKIFTVFSKMQFKSEEASLEVEADYHPPFLSIKKPVEIRYQLKPEKLEKIKQFIGLFFPKIKRNAEIDCKIFPITLDLSQPLLSNLETKGEIIIDGLSFESDTTNIPVLEEINLGWNINTLKKLFALNMEALAYDSEASKPGQIEAYAELENWLKEDQLNFEKLITEVQLDLTNLPTSFLGLLNPSMDWKDLIGRSIDFALKAKADVEFNEKGYLDIVTNSSNLHFKTRLNLNSHFDLFNPLKPSALQWTLSPKSFSSLKKIFNINTPQEIKSPLTLSLKFIDVFIPLKKEEKEPPRLKAQFQTSLIEWETPSDASFSIEGKIESLNLREKIKIFLQTESPIVPPLIIEGTFVDPLTSDFKLRPFETIDADFSVEGKSIPTSFLDNLLFFQKQEPPFFSSIFGKELSISSKAKISHLSGPVNLSLTGPETELFLDGFLQEGTFKLRKDLMIKTRFTPSLKQFLLSHHLSFLNSVLEVSDPISLSIDAQGFSAPLYPFKLEKLSVPKATLSLGKILFKNEEELKALFSFIKPFKEPSFPVWFTPLYFSIDKEKLTLERIDFLVSNTYELALWGKLDLPTLSGPFYLGIPANTFQYLFKIMQFESKDLFVIPFLVEKGKIKTDNKKITQQISIAVMKMQSESQIKALGSLFHLLLSDSNQKNIPEPTTDPFPWDLSSPSKSSSSKSSKKKNDLDLIQNLGKGASKALKRLFN